MITAPLSNGEYCIGVVFMNHKIVVTATNRWKARRALVRQMTKILTEEQCHAKR